MPDLSKRFLVTLAFTALADICLFGHALGAGLAVFAIAIAVLAKKRYRDRLAKTGPWRWRQASSAPL